MATLWYVLLNSLFRPSWTRILRPCRLISLRQEWVAHRLQAWGGHNTYWYPCSIPVSRLPFPQVSQPEGDSHVFWCVNRSGSITHKAWVYHTHQRCLRARSNDNHSGQKTPLRGEINLDLILLDSRDAHTQLWNMLLPHFYFYFFIRSLLCPIFMVLLTDNFSSMMGKRCSLRGIYPSHLSYLSTMITNYDWVGPRPLGQWLWKRSPFSASRTSDRLVWSEVNLEELRSIQKGRVYGLLEIGPSAWATWSLLNCWFDCSLHLK